MFEAVEKFARGCLFLSQGQAATMQVMFRDAYTQRCNAGMSPIEKKFFDQAHIRIQLLERDPASIFATVGTVLSDLVKETLKDYAMVQMCPIISEAAWKRGENEVIVYEEIKAAMDNCGLDRIALQIMAGEEEHITYYTAPPYQIERRS